MGKAGRASSGTARPPSGAVVRPGFDSGVMISLFTVFLPLDSVKIEAAIREVADPTFRPR